MSGKFRVGDVVMLATGGPEMVVSGTFPSNPDLVFCEWFNLLSAKVWEPRKQVFHEGVLDLVEYDEED